MCRAVSAMLGAVMLLTGTITVQAAQVSDTKTADSSITANNISETVIQQTADDVNVIPDKYNTGAKGDLAKVALGDKVENIQFTPSCGGTKNGLDFYYRNKNVEGTVVLENYDFSETPVVLLNADKTDRTIKIIFNKPAERSPLLL